ncbi:DnaJ sub C member 3, partial [Dermatophagoides pteronyssinus]
MVQASMLIRMPRATHIYFPLLFDIVFNLVYCVYGSDVDAHLELGMQLLMKGQLNDALSHYHLAVENDPKNYLTYFKPHQYYQQIEHLKNDKYLVEHLVDIGKCSEAIPLLDKLSQELYWSYELRDMRAHCFESIGDIINAINDLRALTKMKSDNTDGFLKLSKLHYQIGEPEESLNAIRECLKLDPDHKECHQHYKKVKKLANLYKLATDFAAKNDHQGCIDKLQQGLELETNVPNLVHLFKSKLCHCLNLKGNSQEAIKICSEVLELNPNDIHALCDRADSYINLENYDDASSDYKKVLQIDENMTRAKDGYNKAERLKKQSKKRDYYKILGVPRHATKKDIMKAYRKAASKWHPDQYQGDEKKKAEEKFINIAAAKEVLTDPEKREKFDNGEDPLDPEQQNGNGFHPFSQGFDPFGGQIHQAVILIDNDGDSFAKLSSSSTRPKVLMNLIDRPILQYTFEMLSLSNIDEIFLFCCEFFDEIKKFIDDYNHNVYVKLNIQIFYSEDYTSLGPVMRDLDSRGLIKSNFILMHGDCIGNLHLDKMIEKHKENMKKDPGCVMTCLFRKVWPDHRSRRSSSNQKTMIALDSQQKIVLFEKPLRPTTEIPTELFEKNSCISFHYDLFDTEIAICSEKVPPDFSDNFDFETRENFIHGLLADIELLCHHIHVEILDKGYAARVDCIQSYRNISNDLLQRFVSPIVPQAFYDEVYDSLLRAIKEQSDQDNIILEINSSKHAYNVPVNEVNALVIKALLNLARNSNNQQQGNSNHHFLQTINSNLKYGLPIIRNYIKSISSQNDCIYAVEEFQLQNKESISSLYLVKIIEFLYEENILEEDLILKWFYRPKSLSNHLT